MSIYHLILRLIETGDFIEADLMEKLDVFYMMDEITDDEFDHLMSLIQPEDTPLDEEVFEEVEAEDNIDEETKEAVDAFE